MFKLNKNGLLLASTTSFLFACSATQTADPMINKANAVQPKAIKAAQSITSNTQSNLLTLEQIMADPDWMGRQPKTAYWGDNSATVYYQQKQHGGPLSDLWAKALDGKSEASQVKMAELHLHAYQDRVLNQAKNMAAWVFEGNIFVKNINDKSVQQLTKDNNQAEDLAFLNDGRLSFKVGNAIYAIHPGNGLYEQLVAWQFSDKPLALEAPEDYLAEQQQQLIEVIGVKRKQKKLRFDRRQSLSQQNTSMAPADLYFSKDNETVETSLSPNGKWLILVEREQYSWRDDDDTMPNYINDDGRINADEVRRRVADETPQSQTIWLVNIQDGTKRKLSYNSLPGYNEDVLAVVKRENAEAKGQQYTANRLPRDIGLIEDWYWSQSAIQWHNNGHDAAIMLEAWDNKDRWLTTVDTVKATLVNQHRLHDDAWINYKFNSFGWLNNNSTLYYLSEESGYSNLYLKPLNSKPRAITAGKFEIDDLTLTTDDKHL